MLTPRPLQIPVRCWDSTFVCPPLVSAVSLAYVLASPLISFIYSGWMDERQGCMSVFIIDQLVRRPRAWGKTGKSAIEILMDGGEDGDDGRSLQDTAFSRV